MMKQLMYFAFGGLFGTSFCCLSFTHSYGVGGLHLLLWCIPHGIAWIWDWHMNTVMDKGIIYNRIYASLSSDRSIQEPSSVLNFSMASSSVLPRLNYPPLPWHPSLHNSLPAQRPPYTSSLPNKRKHDIALPPLSSLLTHR
jgi:hypothetical protein